jgi:CubicO group peptidase (beta-lactamase class C family)
MIPLLFLVFCACGAETETESGLVDELDQIFAQLETESAFNGAVLVAERGRVVYRRAFGVSDIESGALLDAESGFELASVSKTFTAVAIHQLVEGGKLDYEDALPKFFPDLPYSAVTIRGLLSHTSGLFDVYERDDLRAEFYNFYGKTDPPYSNKDYLAFLEEFKPELDNEPFVEDRYSNSGFVLLALIVEEVSGEEFDDFLRKNIFEPAGMTSTFVFSKMDPQEVPEFAKGHEAGEDGRVRRAPAPDAPPRMRGLTYGDDDMVSTLDDMFAFDQALRSGRLLSPETLERAFTPVNLRDGRAAGHGLGFAISEEEERRYVSHGGSTAGFWSYCQFSTPENDNTVVLLTNLTGPQRRLGPIHESIRRVLAR